MDNEFSEFIPDCHFELIAIKNLVSNQDYQRALSETQVKRAITDFDVYQVNPVKVSRREGINYVFNGQHTIEIIAAASGSRETPVWCMIYDNLEYDKEANIFANQMKHVRPLTAYEIFIANIEAGNTDQILIKELVESYGLRITPTPIAGGINAVSSLERIYYNQGHATLDKTLQLCISTWEGASKFLCANLLNAVAKIVEVYGSEIDTNMFKEKNQNLAMKDLSRTAKELHGGSVGYAEALIRNYNQRLRNPLDTGRLYARKRSNPQNNNNTVSFNRPSSNDGNNTFTNQSAFVEANDNASSL